MGGWLLLERWITPSLFDGLAAKDEYSFCLETKSDGYSRLKKHRNTFITKNDFEWLVQNKINAVRIPIGYWTLEDQDPFINCAEQLDNAFKWAEEFGLKVILDLHGAPGSQNGLDHSGKTGSIEWVSSQNIEQTIKTIEQLTKRYCTQKALWGIELLNEPGWDIPLELLKGFYEKGYGAVRAHCDKEVAVIICDGFRPLKWNNFMIEPEFRNVILDSHLYQVFTTKDKGLSIEGHINKAHKEWGRLLSKIDKPVIIGEWSLGLDPKAFVGMDTELENAALKSYAKAQRETFNNYAGWFFWTYKTEDMPGWNYRHCVESGLLK